VRVCYFTSGVTGSGRLVLGASICNGLRRLGHDIDFSVISAARNADFLAPITHYSIPIENEGDLDRAHFRGSRLFRQITQLKPDLLIVDLLWFALVHFIDELGCKKIFLSRQVDPGFFAIKPSRTLLRFDPAPYDRVLAIEPYDCPVTDEFINPIVIRNPEEILSREEACGRLGLDPWKRNCLFSLNVEDAAFRKAAESYSYLKDEGYALFYSSLFSEGLFPIVDYFNAFDLVVSGAGYNAFWEAVYFNKKAVFLPQPKRFENQKWRVDRCRDFRFTRNGADELSEIIAQMLYIY